MKKQPKVSVIIPVFNAELYLCECLDSILNQTLSNIEIICVNDGSTDKSATILEEYALKDKRISVIFQKNAGAGAARNVGLEQASGEYLSFLDADDFFDKDMLKIATEQADNDNADIVAFSAVYYNQTTGESLKPAGLLNIQLINIEKVFSYKDYPQYIFNFTDPCAWNKLFKHDFIKRINLHFQEIPRVNDAYFTIIALAKAERISIIDKTLLTYRTGNPESLQGTNTKTPTSAYQALCAIKQTLVKDELFAELEQSFVNRCLATCLYILDTMKNCKSFVVLYNRLKEEYFKELHILGHDENYFYMRYHYQKLVQIMHNTPTEYLFLKLNELLKANTSFPTQYPFPLERIGKGSRIIIYGAGKMGQAYYRQAINAKDKMYEIVLWVDRAYKDLQKVYLPVSNPDEVLTNDCDYILIAVIDKKSIGEIMDFLMSHGISKEKIIGKMDI